MIQAALHGRLGGDPVERETRNGNVMVTASLAVAVNRFGESDDTEWFSLVAFGTTAELLAKHAKADVVAVSGTMTRRRYTGRDGVEREGWSVTIDSLVSARTVRPGGGKRRRDDQAPAQRSNGRAATLAEGELNDDLPL